MYCIEFTDILRVRSLKIPRDIFATLMLKDTNWRYRDLGFKKLLTVYILMKNFVTKYKSKKKRTLPEIAKRMINAVGKFKGKV